ncbi:hypothetical protein [Thalassobellus citreus]
MKPGETIIIDLSDEELEAIYMSWHHSEPCIADTKFRELFSKKNRD